MALTKYSIWLPDGRTLSAAPGPEGFAYALNDQSIDRAEAETVWDAQPEDWQRGRRLDDALRAWQGSAR
jgi:hypothetical protein